MVLLHQSKSVEKIYANAHYQLDRVARDSQQDSVVIKTINPQFNRVTAKAWLENEYSILTQLNYAGIIKPLSLENYKSGSSLVFEDFKVQNLIQFLESQDLTLAAFFDIAIQLVEIIEELHQHSIIHQNIQPGSNFNY